MRKIVILIVRLNSVNPSKQSVQISDQTLLLFSFVILIGSIFTSIVTPFSMDHRTLNNCMQKEMSEARASLRLRSSAISNFLIA